MGRISKTFALSLTIVIAVSCLTLLTVKPVNAQTKPKPSVPLFTVRFVEMVSTPSTKDKLPLVNITIESQPFTSYNDQNGNKINLYYLIDWKRSTDYSWQQTEIPLSQLNNNNTSNTLYFFQQTGINSTTYMVALVQSGSPSPAGPVEFQVEAVIGYISYGGYTPTTIKGETSGWSTTQTIVIPTSRVSEFPVLVIVPLLLSVFSIVVILGRRKTKSTSQETLEALPLTISRTLLCEI